MTGSSDFGVHRHGSSLRRKPGRGFPFWLIAGILVFSPVPFASVGAVWPALYGLLVGVALLIYVLQRWGREPMLPPLAPPVSAAAVLIALVALWGLVQAMPGGLFGLQHPAWQVLADRFPASATTGFLSVAPDRTLGVSIHFLTYVGFGLLVLWHTRSQRNADLLLKIFVGAQGAFALYGLAVYFSGAEAILWFDKTSYFRVLTSTFVNRNNYATYAGLGVLASLALVLRYLRRTFSEEQSRVTRIREFVETLTSRGWLPPMVVLLCFLAVLLTGSRMGLIAMLIASAVLLLRWMTLLPPGNARRVGGVVLLVLVSVLTLNISLSGGFTLDRLTQLLSDGDGRFDVYPLILNAIDQRPWTGYGLGTFETAFRAFRTDAVPVVYDRGHSDYLELIMDGGWVVATMVFAAFLCLLAAAWRFSSRHPEPELALLSLAATVQIGIHSSVDFSMQIPAVVYAYLFVALLGLPARSPVADRR